MGTWDSITNAINKIPGAGEVNKLGKEAVGFIGQQQLPGGKNAPTLGQIPGDIASLFHGGAGGSTDPAASSSQANDLISQLSGLTYGQVQGSGASGLAKQLAAQLQGMPAADAEKVIAALNKQDPGSTLASDITSDINPPAANPHASTYGFDPLSLGKIFETTLAPWLAQQQSQSVAGENNTAKQMQAALSGASPSMQQAYSLAIPEMQTANQQSSAAAKSALATAPEWDALILQLTNASQAAKLAQAAAQAEPYWAATTSGVAPAAGQTAGQKVLFDTQQQILGQTAANH